MKQLYVIGLIALAAAIIGLAWAEQMTFSTYYPAPAGVYNQMVTRCLGVGDQDGGGSIDYADAPDPSIAAQENDLWVAGSVGIGTTSLSAQLELYDSSGTANSALIWDPNSALRIGMESGTNYIESGSTTTSGSTADLKFTDMLNTECWMIIKDDGNVGIGTMDPQTPAPDGNPGNLDVSDVYLRSTGQWVSEGGFDPADIDSTGWGNDSAGSVTCPNGLIVKWGKVSRAGDQTPVTFATAFPSACFQVFACSGNSANNPGYDVSSHTISNTGFIARAPGSNSDPIRWFAAGR